MSLHIMLSVMLSVVNKIIMLSVAVPRPSLQCQSSCLCTLLGIESYGAEEILLGAYALNF